MRMAENIQEQAYTNLWGPEVKKTSQIKQGLFQAFQSTRLQFFRLVKGKGACI